VVSSNGFVSVYDASSGAKRGSIPHHHYSRISLHPSQEWVFAAYNHVSPSDIEKFDITGSGIVSLGDSPYHGEYWIDGRVWSTPDSQYVITASGDVFLASAMTHVKEMLANSVIRDLVFDKQN